MRKLSILLVAAVTYRFVTLAEASSHIEKDPEART